MYIYICTVQYFHLILYKNLIDPKLHIPLFNLRIYDLHEMKENELFYAGRNYEEEKSAFKQLFSVQLFILLNYL